MYGVPQLLQAGGVCSEGAASLRAGVSQGGQRELARGRRAKAVHDYRIDERLRQQKCREKRKEAGGRHALPSAPKYADIKRKVLDSWDRATAASRASLERRLPGIVRAILRSDGTAQAPVEALSRASLGS